MERILQRTDERNQLSRFFEWLTEAYERAQMRDHDRYVSAAKQPARGIAASPPDRTRHELPRLITECLLGASAFVSHVRAPHADAARRVGLFFSADRNPSRVHLPARLGSADNQLIEDLLDTIDGPHASEQLRLHTP